MKSSGPVEGYTRTPKVRDFVKENDFELATEVESAAAWSLPTVQVVWAPLAGTGQPILLISGEPTFGGCLLTVLPKAVVPYVRNVKPAHSMSICETPGGGDRRCFHIVIRYAALQ